MSAINFALSTNYKMPPVIEAIAHDLQRPEMQTRQRASIKLAEAEKWGIFKNGEEEDFPFEDAMFLLQFESYIHPRTVNSFLKMLEEYRWWENGFFYEFEPYKKVLPAMRKLRLTKPFASYFEWDFCRNTREEVNTITYRTPDYMLSCAQDYRPGLVVTSTRFGKRLWERTRFVLRHIRAKWKGYHPIIGQGLVNCHVLYNMKMWLSVFTICTANQRSMYPPNCFTPMPGCPRTNLMR